MTRAVVRVRIVVLRNEPDVWCDTCAAACATTTVCAIEAAHVLAVHRLTWCDTCEHHQFR